MRMHTLCGSTILAIAVALSALHPPRAWGQEVGTSPGAGGQVEESIVTAPVTIDGVELFKVRGITSYPAAERARAIAGRIEALAASPAFKPDTLRVEESDVASAIMADRQTVLNVYDADARVEGVRRTVLATAYLGRVRTAVVAYRADRSPTSMQRAAVDALIATLVFAMLMVAIVWAWRKLDAFIDIRYRQRVESLAARSHDVVSASRAWSSFRTALRFVRSAAVVVLAFVYAEYALALYPHTRPVARNLAGYVVGPLATMWTSFVSKIPDLIFLAILVVVVRIVLRVLRRVFEAIESGRIVLANFDQDWAAPTYKLVRPLVIALAIVVGYPYIPGSSSEAFKGLSLFLGIVVSLGSSSFIANMIAGYSMTYRRAFRIGDLVEIGDVMGVVTTIRLQVTHLRTIKNEEVVFPNSQILGTHVTNFSTLAQTKGLVLHTTVGIGYETPWRQVEAMLLEAARRTPGLVPEPAPFVFHLQLGDFCVTYELNVYCSDPLKMRATYTDLHRHILDVFNEYGVQIMTPAYEGDPDNPKVVPREQWYAAPAEATPPRTSSTA